jgi:hypothetical protein
MGDQYGNSIKNNESYNTERATIFRGTTKPTIPHTAEAIGKQILEYEGIF